MKKIKVKTLFVYKSQNKRNKLSTDPTSTMVNTTIHTSRFENYEK